MNLPSRGSHLFLVDTKWSENVFLVQSLRLRHSDLTLDVIRQMQRRVTGARVTESCEESFSLEINKGMSIIQCPRLSLRFVLTSPLYICGRGVLFFDTGAFGPPPPAWP